MTTSVETYRNDLLLALRLRDVPGPRIAEVLAEVESHVGETAEDPRETFGSPGGYAEQVAAALGLAGRGGLGGWLTALRGEAGLLGLLALAGGWLLPTGLFHLGAGTTGPAGIPATALMALGALIWLAVGLRLRLQISGTADRVLDPRTGADMAPATPRWAGAVSVGAPLTGLVLCYVLGLMTR
ncbi:MAG: hypothetical protein LH469_07065 [Frankiaceae bacterium]|nr:hypothetical protein [Frankiaceae bacterium]